MYSERAEAGPATVADMAKCAEAKKILLQVVAEYEQLVHQQGDT